MADSIHTGPDGIALIKRNEGCELTAYLDTIANPPVWTIGYGDTKNVYKGLVITQAQAESRLAGRLAAEFEPWVLKALDSAPVSQKQFDAMISLEWNIGIGRLDPNSGFTGSSVARLHKAGNYKGAADAFRLWNKAGGKVIPGLARRREEERALYLQGTDESVASMIPTNGVPSPEPGEVVYDKVSCAKDMQTALKKYGKYQGVIDGIWGNGSKNAYLDFVAD